MYIIPHPAHVNEWHIHIVNSHRRCQKVFARKNLSTCSSFWERVY